MDQHSDSTLLNLCVAAAQAPHAPQPYPVPLLRPEGITHVCSCVALAEDGTPAQPQADMNAPGTKVVARLLTG